MSHTFNPTIIREYDIRGTVGKNLHITDAAPLGRAFGTMVSRAGGKRVMVGYDGRTSSPELEGALVEGLLSTGVELERIGLGPTPMLYFSVHEAKADAGIMVTGSHNPPDQNGFKMMLAKNLKGGGPVYGDAVRKLAELAEQGDFVTGQGTAKKTDIRDAYIAHLRKAYTSPKDLTVAWDCCNGASGEIVKRLTAQLPGKHIVLFDTVDGHFPNHGPDPSDEENLRFLQDAVLREKCDLGIAFDGDADRIIAVDGQGRALLGDQLLAVFAGDILQSHPGAPIVADVKASQTLFDQIAAWGGKPIMWKTGNPLIKVKMAEVKAPVAGEMSGHIFFGDNNNADDGIYAGMKLLSLIGRSGKSLAARRDEQPAMVTGPELRFPVDEARKFKVVEDIKRRLETSGAKVNDTDGVRVTTPDGWWLLRASNTQAVLVARAESATPDGLARLKAQLAEQLKASGLALPANA